MPEINNETLIIAIQSVATELRSLHDAIVNGEAEPEEYQLLEEYTRAAEDLKRAYDAIAITIINLPPYNELIAG